MKQNKVLLTGYHSDSNDLSTTEVMLNKINNHYEKFMFASNFDCIKEQVKEILKKEYDYILMFGWKPVVKKLSIEIECHLNNDYLFTNFPLEKILLPLKRNNIDYKISENPGNSYCNFAYYQTLKYIKENKLNTKAIFIHIPHLNNFIELDKVIDLINKIKF